MTKYFTAIGGFAGSQLAPEVFHRTFFFWSESMGDIVGLVREAV